MLSTINEFHNWSVEMRKIRKLLFLLFTFTTCFIYGIPNITDVYFLANNSNAPIYLTMTFKNTIDGEIIKSTNGSGRVFFNLNFHYNDEDYITIGGQGWDEEKKYGGIMKIFNTI